MEIQGVDGNNVDPFFISLQQGTQINKGRRSTQMEGPLT
jgi:hypothetical protein